MQQALEDGDPTNVQPSLVEGDVLASLTYEAPQEDADRHRRRGRAARRGIDRDRNRRGRAGAGAGQELEQQPEPEPRARRVEDLLAEEDSETVRSPALVAAAADRRCRSAAASATRRPLQPSRLRLPPAPRRSVEEEDDGADFDAEVAAIFSEEATELLETADHALSSWQQDRGNTALVFELKRVVHTLKGGARMAGIRAMGNLSHELETLMQGVEAGTVPAAPEVFDALQVEPRRAASHARCRQSRRALRIRA